MNEDKAMGVTVAALLLLAVFLIVGVIAMVPLGVIANKTQCDMMGRTQEVDWRLVGGCFIETDKGWVSQSDWLALTDVELKDAK